MKTAETCQLFVILHITLCYLNSSRCYSGGDLLLGVLIQATGHLVRVRVNPSILFSSPSNDIFNSFQRSNCPVEALGKFSCWFLWGGKYKFLLKPVFSFLTGVNICTLSLKLPIKIMIDMRWLSLSIRLNCIMKRSSSLSASTGFLSLSYCRRSFISASVGKNLIKHSTKSTRIVRRSNLQKHKPTYPVMHNPSRHCLQSQLLLSLLSNMLEAACLSYGSRIVWSCTLHLNIRVDRPTDDVRSLTSLPKSDGQVFGSVGLKQRDFGWTFLRKLLSGEGQVHRWTLGFCLEQLLKPFHIQILGSSSKKTVSPSVANNVVLVSSKGLNLHWCKFDLKHLI